MTGLDDLPTEADDSDFSGLTPEKAEAMLASVSDEEVDGIVAALEVAQKEYAADASKRKYVVGILKGLGTVAAFAKRFVV